MKDARNKSKRLKEKNYLDRFDKLSVYSSIRENKIYLGVKPEDVYELFSNACGKKKEVRKDSLKDDDCKDINSSVDQSTSQYYIILGLQDSRSPVDAKRFSQTTTKP